MCGRYTLNASPEAIAEHFGLPEMPDLLLRYIVAPTQMCKAKLPSHFRPTDGGHCAFAGRFGHWSRGGQSIDSCTRITGEPNHLVLPVHDRMPVLLPTEW